LEKKKNHHSARRHQDCSDDSDQQSRLYRLSQRLLHRGIHHTRFDIQSQTKKTSLPCEQDLLETNNNMDLPIWLRAFIKSESCAGGWCSGWVHSCAAPTRPRDGIFWHWRSHGRTARKVVARCGHDLKRVLTFFYEFPRETFASQAEFAQRVQERELAMSQKHWKESLDVNSRPSWLFCK
jgi:hypothetical protein